MVDEPRTPRHAIRAFALALMSCLALAAAMASSAAAVSFHPQEEVFPAEFDLSGSALQFVTESVTINCGGTTGSGKMESETAGSVTLEIHNCKYLGGGTCATIVTKPLGMDLAKLPDGSDGILFDPIKSNTFAEFNCGGSYVWSGSVIGKITSPGYNVFSTELSVAFQGSGNNQAYTQTYHGREAQLLSSVSGKKGQKTALHFSAGLDNFYGEEGGFELSPEGDEHPDLVPDAGFPLSYSGWVNGENAVLHIPVYNMAVTCTKTQATPAGTTSGKFTDSHSGEIELTFTNCIGPLGVKCNSAGQEKGTIKTESLPVELTYLPDASPGLAIKANKTSNKVMEFTCSFLANTTVRGGVLGSLSSPKLGERLLSFGAAMNTAGEGEGYAQEYTETESGEKVGLTAEVNGGAPQATSLGMSPGGTFATFPSYAELRE